MKDCEQHTFVVCVYKESQYLEECIKSLLSQTVKSKIVMVTSTPNNFVNKIAEKYEIPLIINKGDKGIVQDWNFGYSQANTSYVTIAHQDDVYLENYTEQMLILMNNAVNPLIYFCNYAEIRNGKLIKDNKLLKIKRFMLLPLKSKVLQKSKFMRRRILSLGCPICCPSVSFARDNLPEVIFQTGFRSDEDWQAWERLSKMKGSFVYNSNILMGHRIHEESETSNILRDNERTNEDYKMFCKFWPRPIARILARLYSEGEKSNDL